MIGTLTNTSGGNLNALDLAEDGVAVGGNRLAPLPYPFSVPQNISATGTLANGASKALVIHPRDMNRSLSPSFGDGQPPGVLLTQMAQKGQITLTYAAQADRTDKDELLLAAV